MKRVLMLAAALLVLMVASPAPALTQDEAQQMAKSVGCEATVERLEYPGDGFNAYYNSLANEIYLVNFSRLPESWQRLIFWHEVGHCMQWKEGREHSFKRPYDREWDADAFAIKTLAEEGIDGAELNAEIYATLYEQYDYVGDSSDSHGTAVGRVQRGNLNRVTRRIES